MFKPALDQKRVNRPTLPTHMLLCVPIAFRIVAVNLLPRFKFKSTLPNSQKPIFSFPSSPPPTKPLQKMLASHSPLSGHQSVPPPKSSRKPLQPKNTLLTLITPNENPKPKQNPDWIEISLVDNSNKENFAPSDYYATPIKAPIESFDASLAEELSAIREKLERLRIDKEKTEKMLKERDLILDMKMKELVQRGEVQKHFEIEVDRLYRLNEIKLSCKRISPLRSLRDKERENNKNEDQNRGNKRDEQKCESPLLQSPKSEQETGN